MIRRAALILAAALTLAGCQSVGPVHIGEINQGRATLDKFETAAQRYP